MIYYDIFFLVPGDVIQHLFLKFIVHFFLLITYYIERRSVL